MEAVELRSRKTAADAAERDKSAKAELAALKTDAERVLAANEALKAEKWELTAANTDLKNRLQQSMALSYMQVILSFQLDWHT